MSGYETSFAGGEDEVAASPEFQHDASDAPDSAESEEMEKIAKRPASDDVLDADDAGMTG